MTTIRDTGHVYIKFSSVYSSHKQKSKARRANLPLHYWKKPEGEETF